MMLPWRSLLLLLLQHDTVVGEGETLYVYIPKHSLCHPVFISLTARGPYLIYSSHSVFNTALQIRHEQNGKHGSSRTWRHGTTDEAGLDWGSWSLSPAGLMTFRFSSFPINLGAWLHTTPTGAAGPRMLGDQAPCSRLHLLVLHSVWPLDCGWNPDDRLVMALM